MAFILPESMSRGILVVEDGQTIRERLVHILSREGYETIHQAENGVEALHRIREFGSEIYLIILDIRMPEMDGFTFLKHLTNGSEYPVGVLILTGYPSMDYVRQFFKMGTEDVIPLDFLVKPVIDESALLRDVEASLERIHLRRKRLLDSQSKVLHDQLEQLRPLVAMPETVKEIQKKIEDISKKQHGFLAQLGLDLVRAIIIALAIIAFLFMGIGDFLRNLINTVQ